MVANCVSIALSLHSTGWVMLCQGCANRNVFYLLEMKEAGELPDVGAQPSQALRILHLLRPHEQQTLMNYLLTQ